MSDNSKGSFVFTPAGLERMRKLLRAFFRFFHFTRINGRENIPTEGPLLFAANHQSYYDPVLICAAQDLPMRFMAWDALFEIPIISDAITDWGAFPVDPDGADLAGFRTCLRLLAGGERILIFPEGGRTRDGKLMALREGIARLSIRTGVPIVPVRLTGAFTVWARGDLAPRPFFRIDVDFLPPIRPNEDTAPGDRHAESDRIMEALRVALEPDEAGRDGHR